MLIPVLLFAVGLVLLIYGGDWFVDGATGVAYKFGLPELLVGATVVSIGTTLPEVMVSATSALSGHGQIAYGNAIGSVICNTALISAITLAVRPGLADRKTLKIPVVFFFAAATYYCFNAYIVGEFTRTSGIIFLCIFAAYIAVQVYQVTPHKKGTAAAATVEEIIAEAPPEIAEEAFPEEKTESENSLAKDLVLLVVGAAVIAVGADLLVDNGTLIAEALGVPESVIALTFVALGTSLPELVTAITSLIKGHSDLSLGNIIGANLFNLVLVNGASVTLCPFNVPASKYIAGINSSLILDIPLMIIVMIILTIPPLISGKLKRWQGILLLCLYAGFCGIQFFG